MKLDPKEKEIVESVERGEWRSIRGLKAGRKRYGRYAAATFRKDRRVNIRLSSGDLQDIQVKALEEGLPYQTLIASVLHKYVTGRLAEREGQSKAPIPSQKSVSRRAGKADA